MRQWLLGALLSLASAVSLAGYSVSESEIGVMMKDPEARVILERYLPETTGDFRFKLAQGFTLDFIAKHDKYGELTDENLARMQVELAALSGGDVKPAPPNVLVWMMDDVGFAQISSYGGLVETPNVDRVAKAGLRYANYYTAPICSASRAAFLGGRNTHTMHMGGHAAGARPFPGYDAKIPASAGSIAENLHQAGYRTFALGKWDHLLGQEATPAGPFNQWPAGQGFDHFYGFLAADADNWTPVLIKDKSPVATPDKPGYLLNDDLADQAIAMFAQRDAGSPRAPFFMYWATGTAHAPHHAPKRWIDHYKGKFDMGWDKAREMILATQKAEGIVPESTRLAPRPEGMPAWDSLSAKEKKLYARQMEVFAAALSHADEQFGRLLDELEDRGELDNTVIIITSDNGASAEGAYHGLYNEAALGSGQTTTVDENMEFYDEWGGPKTYPHYSFGWAVAGNTPFRYYKQTAHEGGIHVPFIIAWPAGIADEGEWRKQFVHVSDVAPTIMDLAGVPLAKVVNDVEQQPMDGESFKYSIQDANAPGRKKAQYFEMYGNKSLVSQGWSIVTSHRLKTWDVFINPPIDEPWELYDLRTDPGQTTNLADKYPDKVAELNQLFDEQARRYHVYPMGNLIEGAQEQFRKGSMEFGRRKGVWEYGDPVSNIAAFTAPPIHMVSYTMTAKLDLPEGNITGPIYVLGGALGGIGLYLEDNKPVVIVNSLKGETQELVATKPLPEGHTNLKMKFTNKPKFPEHDVTLWADGELLIDGKIDMVMPRTFGLPETFDIGVDQGSTVMAGWKSGEPFAGKISDIVFQFDPDVDVQAAAGL